MAKLLKGVFVKVGVEADYELILDSVGWSPQVATRPHRLLQEGLFLFRTRCERLDLLALGDCY